MVVYFSGTGNSKYIAERIAGSLQEKLLCMNAVSYTHLRAGMICSRCLKMARSTW